MRIRAIAYCSMFAAMLCVCAWISLPFGDTVITLQTFALFLSLLLLGGRRSFWVCCVYLLLGAAGLPVFSGFRGGIGMLLGPTGGFLWGFPIAAVVYALCGKRKLSGLLLGIAACYLCGSLWYWAVYLPGGFGLVLARCVLPYLLPDGLKLWLAWVLFRRLQTFIPLPSRA